MTIYDLAAMTPAGACQRCPVIEQAYENDRERTDLTRLTRAFTSAREWHYARDYSDTRQPYRVPA